MTREIDRGIDRALREERTVMVSHDFAARVMSSVRLEAHEAQAIAFPSRRMGAGLGLSVLLMLLQLRLDLSSAGRAAGVSLDARPELVAAAMWVALSLTFGHLLVWWSLRLCGGRD